MAIFNAKLGDVVRIGKAPNPILVKDAAGTLVDPSSITITVKRPDGTATTPATPTRETTGTYHYDYQPAVTATMAGRHYGRIVTTGPDAEYEITIYFSPSRFVP
jgi:hypothetical protein